MSSPEVGAVSEALGPAPATLRIALLLPTPEAVADFLTPIAALCDRGHSVHLALQQISSAPRGADARLFASYPSLSIGYAPPRRDPWLATARRLRSPDPDGASETSSRIRAGLRRALPPDPAMVSYLAQLDLDLVLLTDGSAEMGVQADCLLACRRLGLATACLAAPGQTEAVSAPDDGSPPTLTWTAGAQAAFVEAAEAKAGRRPAADATAVLWRPLLWASRVMEGGGEDDDDALGATGVAARLQEVYARRAFPALVRLGAALLPGEHPILEDQVLGRLRPERLERMLSVEAALSACAAGGGPIVIGPWLGDVDLEILYWLPFLRWYRKKYRIDKDRMILISRGGVQRWYDTVGGRYLDLGELFPPDEAVALESARAEELTRRGKLFGVTQADQTIFRRALRHCGLRHASLLPPTRMAQTFEPYWEDQAGQGFIAGLTRFQAFTLKEKRVRAICPGLPARYLAVSFQARESFPDTPGNRDVVAGALERLSQRIQIVLLDPPHAPGLSEGVAETERIHRLEPVATGLQDAQSAAIAGGEAFVGSHNGLAYLAGHFGKAAVCVESHPSRLQSTHKAFAQRQLPALGGRLTFLDAQDARGLEQLFNHDPIAENARS